MCVDQQLRLSQALIAFNTKSKPNNVAAAVYIRTSSSTNVGDDKDSAVRQLAVIHAYAEQSKLEVSDAAVFSDEGVSGTKPLMFRPAWRDLMDYCEKRNVKIVLFEDSSRFARDLVIQEQGFKEMVAQGYDLISATTPAQFLHDSPEATLVRQLLGAVAQFQRDSTTTRLHGARVRSAETKGKRSLITGKLKTQGKRSRLDGDDAPIIKEALQPWVSKRTLQKGDVKLMVEALDTVGIKSSSNTKLTHCTAKDWWKALKDNNFAPKMFVKEATH